MEWVRRGILDLADAIGNAVRPGELGAVLLVGSFGRGEASIAEGPDGRVKVFSDLDLVVVPKGQGLLDYLEFKVRYGRTLADLAEHGREATGAKHVDIAVKPHDFFRTASPLTIERYEIWAGAKRLLGDVDPRDCWPALDPTLLPLVEGTRLLRNRGGGLVLAGLTLAGGLSRPRWLRNAATEVDKAAIALGDCALLRRGEYVCSYAERLEQAICCNGSNEMEEHVFMWYRKALRRKLHPSALAADAGEVTQDLSSVSALFSHYALQYEEGRLGRRFAGWCEYGSAAARTQTLRRLGRIGLEIIRGYGPATARLRADLSYSLALVGRLVSALDGGDIRPDERSRPNRSAMASKEWMVQADKFVRSWHPDGIAGEILREVKCGSR